MNDFERGMWEVLKQLQPDRMDASFHIVEDIYKLGDREFHVFFEVGKDKPINIDIHQ